MKNVLIGIVAVLVLAFAAHAAYSNFATGSKRKTAAPASQPAPVATVNQQDNDLAYNTQATAPVVLQQADTATLAAATPRVTTRMATTNNNATTQKPATVTTATQKTAQQQAPVLKKIDNSIATKKIALDENEIDDPNTVAGYDFAFVDPEVAELNTVSGATELALQNVTEDAVLSPSAPR